jgi:hypothetical protein
MNENNEKEKFKKCIDNFILFTSWLSTHDSANCKLFADHDSQPMPLKLSNMLHLSQLYIMRQSKQPAHDQR